MFRKDQPDISIVRSYKGNVMVAMLKHVYINNCKELLSEKKVLFLCKEIQHLLV